jgi:hypothetical protein
VAKKEKIPFKTLKSVSSLNLFEFSNKFPQINNIQILGVQGKN